MKPSTIKRWGAWRGSQQARAPHPSNSSLSTNSALGISGSGDILVYYSQGTWLLLYFLCVLACCPNGSTASHVRERNSKTKIAIYSLFRVASLSVNFFVNLFRDKVLKYLCFARFSDATKHLKAYVVKIGNFSILR